jgi:intron-binding protein aquarius
MIILVQLLQTSFDISSYLVGKHEVDFCERVLDFLTYLVSNFPTRRYVNILLEDHQVIMLSQMSPLFKIPEGTLFRRLLETLQRYIFFPVNDFSAAAYTDLEQTSQQYTKLTFLQELGYQQFPQELKELALSNLSSLLEEKNLKTHLKNLSVQQLHKLCDLLHLRTSEKSIFNIDIEEREYYVSLICHFFSKRESEIDFINKEVLLPDENTLFDDEVIRIHNYNGEGTLAIPRINLQYLTIRDFLWRNYHLYKLESSYAIRKDIQDAVQRLSPKINWNEGVTNFTGWSRMANMISTFAITEVAKPKVGEDFPARVVAEVTFSLSDYSRAIQREWDALRPREVLFLLSIEATVEGSSKEYTGETPFRTHYGIRSIRSCEILQGAGQETADVEDTRVVKPRTIKVLLDPKQYRKDMDRFHHGTEEDIYQTFNVLLRRKSKANNFKAVLETVQNLLNEGGHPPEWFNDVLLGYGNPAGLHYTTFPQESTELEFRDTFLDIGHLEKSFPDTRIVHNITHADSHITLNFGASSSVETKQSDKRKKRKKVAAESSEAMDVDYANTVTATTSENNNNTLFSYMKRRNHIRFNPSQVEAIRSGMSHGLSLIVGPPGTGKTDVAVQIISNLYHSKPNERILFIAHSNQAVNQLFEKVIGLGNELDIPLCTSLIYAHRCKSHSPPSFGSWGRRIGQ